MLAINGDEGRKKKVNLLLITVTMTSISHENCHELNTKILKTGIAEFNMKDISTHCAQVRINDHAGLQTTPAGVDVTLARKTCLPEKFMKTNKLRIGLDT